MESADGLQGVMGVTPYGPDPNYGGAAAPDCRKPFGPKNSNNNQMSLGDDKEQDIIWKMDLELRRLALSLCDL